VSKWTFFGKIDPERVPITLPTAVELNAAVHHSQIVIDVETDAGEPRPSDLLSRN